VHASPAYPRSAPVVETAVTVSTSGGSVKKYVMAGVCALALGVVAPAPAAEAAGDRCATKSEYRQVKNGMSKAQVTRIIGSPGRRFFAFEANETREYASCTSESGFVWVGFEGNRVVKKGAVWG
jgi:hypothetical protein